MMPYDNREREHHLPNVGSFMPAIREIVKIVGALCWLGGFAVPIFWFPAIILSILSIVWTRRARHQELVDAIREGRGL